MSGEWALWLVGLLLTYLALSALAEPARYLVLLFWRGVLGYVALTALNLIGLALGYHLPLNPVSALVAGVLGVPGVVALAIIGRLYAGLAV